MFWEHCSLSLFPHRERHQGAPDTHRHVWKPRPSCRGRPSSLRECVHGATSAARAPTSSGPPGVHSTPQPLTLQARAFLSTHTLGTCGSFTAPALTSAPDSS
ncbi:unnamed protein product [Gulo gulo]|uniref:Uncharacterized protein n=1 Tax=Gulo gulo TaxID=48420 RepID=A0A9X9M656_GULGU|nr:unnamed protein product [Gulo gulo]